MFAAKRRPKKKIKPIEGQDVTIQASQPGQTEETLPQADADDSTSTANNVGIVQNVKTTSETATNAATASTPQPTAPSPTSEKSSSSAALPKSTHDESSKTHPAPPALDGTMSGSKPDISQDGPGESLADESAAQPSKSEVAPPAPRVWADLLKSASAASKASTDGQVPINGTDETQTSTSLGPSQPTTKVLSDVLGEYNPSSGKVYFIEPRGLYNARVDCYMISVRRT